MSEHEKSSRPGLGAATLLKHGGGYDMEVARPPCIPLFSWGTKPGADWTRGTGERLLWVPTEIEPVCLAVSGSGGICPVWVEGHLCLCPETKHVPNPKTRQAPVRCSSFAQQHSWCPFPGQVLRTPAEQDDSALSGSRQGKLRLQKWYVPLSDKEKKKITRELVQTVLARKPKMCSFLEWRDLKIVYKRYASLYFCCAIEDQDNELITLEIIHRYVELLDKYFGSVCELDIIFNFEKAYFILDEFLLGGEVQETSKKNVLKAIEQADLLQEMATKANSGIYKLRLREFCVTPVHLPKLWRNGDGACWDEQREQIDVTPDKRWGLVCLQGGTAACIEEWRSSVLEKDLLRCYGNNEDKTDDNPLEFDIEQLALNLKRAF
ncbi:hypothetical protein WISP_62336 [Willisornis vidua]|uniref:AP complex mu/sigma subunit domain-containing protein n=1 Tax=Willisornis vidua TaxID=1566151 RepID=A0ABQ9DG90_9PASS|nr:hypothetical protein WISP_62336 [Willisornis vidua]